VVAVKVHAVFFATALSKRVVMVAGERGECGDLQTKLRGDIGGHRFGSKASMAGWSRAMKGASNEGRGHWRCRLVTLHAQA
jgi:hypothetical protein